MKREAVAKDYQILPLHACVSIFSASFPTSGFDVTLTGMPNFDVISRLFVFDAWPQFSSSANNVDAKIALKPIALRIKVIGKLVHCECVK